jgi:hypothetical protein
MRIKAHKPHPSMGPEITSLFGKLFDRERTLQRAYQLGAIQRLREQHPLDVLLALVCCAVGDEHRSVATARRQFQDLTGFMPEESSFYDRLTPGLADLGWEMFLNVLARANRVQRKAVARALGVHVRDIRVVDASSVTLPRRAAAHFPSTDSKLGGFKLTTTLSLLEDLVVNVRVTDARQHDRKAFALPTDVRSVLWLMDRGYSDHKLFAHIDQGKGSFIIRLKRSSQPVVTAIRSGLAKTHKGQPLDRAVTVQGWRCRRDRRVRVGGHDNEPRPREADRRPRPTAHRRAADHCRGGGGARIRGGATGRAGTGAHANESGAPAGEAVAEASA